MEQITLGQIAVSVALIVGLLSGFAYLYAMIKKWIKSAFTEDFANINRRIDSIEMEASKNFLVQALSQVESSGVDEITKQRIYECYERYAAAGGNSYIRHRFEQLQQEGKL